MTKTAIPIFRIVSGGQTGFDRAALDAARECAIACGGWVPQGRWAADGPIPARHPMRETDSDRYPVRTRANVRDSDATLILCRGAPTGGTALTVAYAHRLGRPVLAVDPTAPTSVAETRARLRNLRAVALNIAGTRESTDVGIGSASMHFLRDVFAEF